MTFFIRRIIFIEEKVKKQQKIQANLFTNSKKYDIIKR